MAASENRRCPACRTRLIPALGRIRREPERDVSALDEGSFVLRPVPDVILRFVIGMRQRLRVKLMRGEMPTSQWRPTSRRRSGRAPTPPVPYVRSETEHIHVRPAEPPKSGYVRMSRLRHGDPHSRLTVVQCRVTRLLPSVLVRGAFPLRPVDPESPVGHRHRRPVGLIGE